MPVVRSAVGKEFSGFVEVLKRATRLVRAVPELGRLTSIHQDLLRASLVLIVASMDAYVHEVVIKMITEQSRVGQMNKEAYKLLFSQIVGDPEDKAYMLYKSLKEEKYVQGKIRKPISLMTFQKAKQLEVAFALVNIDRKNFWEKADADLTKKIRSGSRGRPYSSKANLDEVVHRRDLIVHAADKWTGRSRMRAMKRPDLILAFQVIHAIVKNIESTVNKRRFS